MSNINLLDYLDNPELIEHKDYGDVKALFHFPKNDKSVRIMVVFSKGISAAYYEDGRYSENSDREFRLKPKPKRIVKGYRKAVLYRRGMICTNANYWPTKELFESQWNHCTLLGDWEEIEYEIEED